MKNEIEPTATALWLGDALTHLTRYNHAHDDRRHFGTEGDGRQEETLDSLTPAAAALDLVHHQ